MTTPPPPSREPTLEQKIQMTDSFGKFLHNLSIAMLVGAPVLIALPPRKLDLYTFFLTGSFIASANHLTKERTGAGLLYQLPGARLPPSAIEFQERMRMREAGQTQTSTTKRLLDESTPQTGTIQQELAKRKIEVKHREPAGLEKVAKEIWMGGEKEGWKERRLAEEQKKLDEGEGYGSMIMDQIWDVWNWGEKKAEDIKETDEKVVKERERVKQREDEFPTIGKKG